MQGKIASILAMIIRTLVVILLLSPIVVQAEPARVLVSETLYRSGLVQAIAPQGTQVQAVPQGRILQQASECVADVIAVSNPIDHAEFISQGFGLYAVPGLISDFVIAGPDNTPPALALSLSLSDAMAAIPGFSNLAGPSEASLRLDGLRQVFGIDAAQDQGYTLMHRADWLKQDVPPTIVFQHSPLLSVEYFWVPISSERCPDTDSNTAVAWIEQMTGVQASEAARQYKIAGQSPFILP